jgi:hypothetical protein
MPALFPFYDQIGKSERQVDEKMNKDHQDITDRDFEDVKHTVDYRRNCGWDKKAKRGMAIYNVVQTMSPDDEVSRIFLGYSRMIIDKGIEQMTEGEPDFNFEPRGPSDHMKTIVWKHMIKSILSESDYKMHQELFFRDYFVMGSGVFEVFIDYPTRTLRIPKEGGGFDEVTVQDHRKPKVGVRHINPMNCWRNPNIDNPTQVPSCLRRRTITWNQFAQEFGRCKIDGKYFNLDKIAKGSHVTLFYYQDEIRDIYRIYAKSHGSESDGQAKTPADPSKGLGILLFDTSLKIHEKLKDDIVLRSTGLNIPGMCSLRWGTLFDAYDKNWQGDHQVYGMGLPERIEGEDTVMQTIFNINLDNYRWANSVALNYKGNDADSYLDLDANRLYGAELIDGEITPQPLGISRIGDFQGMREIVDGSSIPSTGINHQQMVGDTSKTAFEFAQRIRMGNRSAEQRLTRLEHEVFKPIGRLLLANSLTTLTVKDFEAMTETEIEGARQSVKEGKRPKDDYNFDKKEKRIMNYVPIRGEKIREDFSVTKKRQLNYNAGFDEKGNSKNTLIYDPKMKVEVSYIPLTEEYVYPAEYIESGLLPDVIVDSKRMLGDMKQADVQNFKAAASFLLELMNAGYENLDLDKIAQAVLEFANIDPKSIVKTDEGGSEKLDELKKMLKQMQSLKDTPQQNAQIPTKTAPISNLGAANAATSGQGQPQSNLEKIASSAI